VYDETGMKIYHTRGPLCPCQCVCGCTGDVNFPLTDVSTGQEVAKIAKVWDGAFKDCCTDADTFGITFPMAMSAKHKALLVAATFVIDFMVFERENNNNQ